jgi:hypothetical protein
MHCRWVSHTHAPASDLYVTQRARSGEGGGEGEGGRRKTEKRAHDRLSHAVLWRETFLSLENE